MHFGSFTSEAEGIAYGQANLSRFPETHMQCFCGRWSWMADDKKPDMALAWGEYTSGRNGVGPVVLKGKIDGACLSALRRNYPQLKRGDAQRRYKEDDAFRVEFEGKRGTSAAALERRADASALAGNASAPDRGRLRCSSSGPTHHPSSVSMVSRVWSIPVNFSW